MGNTEKSMVRQGSFQLEGQAGGGSESSYRIALLPKLTDAILSHIYSILAYLLKEESLNTDIKHFTDIFQF